MLSASDQSDVEREPVGPVGRFDGSDSAIISEAKWRRCVPCRCGFIRKLLNFSSISEVDSGYHAVSVTRIAILELQTDVMSKFNE